MSGREGSIDYTFHVGAAGNLAHALEKAIDEQDLRNTYEVNLAKISFDSFLTTNPVMNASHRIKAAALALRDNVPHPTLEKHYWDRYTLGDFADAKVVKDTTRDSFNRTISLLGLAGKRSKKHAIHQIIGMNRVTEDMAARKAASNKKLQLTK